MDHSFLRSASCSSVRQTNVLSLIAFPQACGDTNRDTTLFVSCSLFLQSPLSTLGKGKSGFRRHPTDFLEEVDYWFGRKTHEPELLNSALMHCRLCMSGPKIQRFKDSINRTKENYIACTAPAAVDPFAQDLAAPRQPKLRLVSE